jgi:hypothetical protein
LVTLSYKIFPVQLDDRIPIGRHIRVHGHYTFTLPDLGGRTYRSVRDPGAAEHGSLSAMV